jgi:thymidylate synthase (FAD)
MKATLIAYTKLAIDWDEDPVIRKAMKLDQWSSDADDLAEFAGRACYQSFDKPNEKTRKNEDYLANILRQQHESVLEHASASFYVEGVSRNLLLELERHRHLSFSVISQRYVDSSETDYVRPPLFKSIDEKQPGDQGPRDLGHAINQQLWFHHHKSLDYYEDCFSSLREAGIPLKQAREAARAFLPGSIETKFVVTGNMRAWRDVLKKRFSVHADREIMELAGELLKQLRTIAPNSFQDFPEVPFD